MMVDRSVSNPIAGCSSNSPESHLSLDMVGRTRKRSMDESPSQLIAKKSRYSWYLKLQSESSEHSEQEDTESVYSVQGHETEVVQDTPDTDTKSESGSTDSEVVFDVEYELADDISDEENPFLEAHSSSGTDDCVMAAAGAAIAAVICDNSLEWLTDGEESDNSSVSLLDTPELNNHTEFGTCIKCKSKNNNPMFRYCQKCFQERKNLFPPRPKGRRRKKKRNSRESKDATREDAYLHKKLENSQDSGAGSTQDLSATLDIVVASTSKEDIKRKTRKNSESLQEAVATSSQDSGIGFGSQDFLTFDNDTKEEETRTTLKRKRYESTESEEDEDLSSSKRTKSDVCNGSDSITSSEVSSTKCSQTTQVESTDLSKSNDLSEVNGNLPFLKPAVIDSSKQKGKETSKVITNGVKNSLPEHKELCIICNNHTKNSIFLHAKIGHMCCCYKCALHTWATNKKCPICNGKVKNIVKVFEC